MSHTPMINCSSKGDASAVRQRRRREGPASRRTRPISAEIEVRSRPLGTSGWLVAVRGEIDLASATAVETTVARSGRGELETLVVDLREVTFIDVAGLRALERACAAGRQAGWRVSLLALRGGAVERLLLLLRSALPSGLGGALEGASISFVPRTAVPLPQSRSATASPTRRTRRAR